MDTKPTIAMVSTMNGIVWSGYGPPSDVLKFGEVNKPTLTNDAVLVRVHAASIHIGDTFMIKGLPKAMRPIFGSSSAPLLDCFSR